jgi:hypothetical protein
MKKISTNAVATVLCGLQPVASMAETPVAIGGLRYNALSKQEFMSPAVPAS